MKMNNYQRGAADAQGSTLVADVLYQHFRLGSSFNVVLLRSAAHYGRSFIFWQDSLDAFFYQGYAPLEDDRVLWQIVGTVYGVSGLSVRVVAPEVDM